MKKDYHSLFPKEILPSPSLKAFSDSLSSRKASAVFFSENFVYPSFALPEPLREELEVSIQHFQTFMHSITLDSPSRSLALQTTSEKLNSSIEKLNPLLCCLSTSVENSFSKMRAPRITRQFQEILRTFQFLSEIQKKVFEDIAKNSELISNLTLENIVNPATFPSSNPSSLKYRKRTALKARIRLLVSRNRQALRSFWENSSTETHTEILRIKKFFRHLTHRKKELYSILLNMVGFQTNFTQSEEIKNFLFFIGWIILLLMLTSIPSSDESS